jgi:hypothetical protein
VEVDHPDDVPVALGHDERRNRIPLHHFNGFGS